MRHYQIIDRKTGEVVDETDWDENDLESLWDEVRHGIAVAAMLKGEIVQGDFEIREAKA